MGDEGKLSGSVQSSFLMAHFALRLSGKSRLRTGLPLHVIFSLHLLDNITPIHAA
jgi:hypothetical protein